MDFEVLIPEEPYSEIRLTIDGKVYSVIFKYTDVSGWMFDLLSDDKSVEYVSGVPIRHSVSLLGRYKSQLPFSGDLICIKYTNTKDSLNLTNLGFEKDYRIIYLSEGV